MASVFTCPNGHQWEDLFGGLSLAMGQPQVCPVCGTRFELASSPAERVTQTPGNSGLPPPVPSHLPATVASDAQELSPSVASTDPTVRAPGKSSPAPAGEQPTIAGYEVLRELGRGGMGVVYLARQESLNRVVALKMILSGPHTSAAGLIRFRAEAEAVARLQHPNIVQIYEIGEQDGCPFFTLEYIEGGSLDKFTARKPQPSRQAAELVETLARAMHFAHQRGIVHRDLKPANVLLSDLSTNRTNRHEEKKEGDEAQAAALSPSCDSWIYSTPKITDFGLAKRLDDTAGSQTRTGDVLGTPNYMAPEQAQGQIHEIGPGTDVYALGAILYVLLTGRPPFEAETPFDTLLQVVNDDPLPPTRLQPKVPRDLETICLKCLQKEIHKRYLSAEALADDLRRFLNGEPIRARPAGTIERLLKWTRRRPAAALLLGVSGLAAVTLFGLSVWFNVELTAAADRERKAAEGERAAADRERKAADRERTERTRAEKRETEANEQRQLADGARRKAEQEEAEARRQRERAETKFREARNAIDAMLTPLAQEHLAYVPGMVQERHKLLEEALKFYQGVLAEKRTEPEWQQETARAYRRVGDVLELLGKHPEAKENYRQALTLFQKLVDGPAARPEYRQELALSYFQMGRLLRLNGDLAGAKKFYDQALALRQQLHSSDSQRDDYRQELARTYNELGLVLRNTDQPQDAEAACDKAVDLLTHLPPGVGENPTRREYLASGLNDRGNLKRVSGRLPEAESDYQEALKHFTQLVKDNPEHTEYRRKKAVTLNNLGLVCLEQRELDQALLYHREALAERDKLRITFSTVPMFRQELAESHSNLGQTHMTKRQVPEAKTSFNDALTLQRELIKDFGANADYQSGLGGILDNLAFLLLRDPKERAELRKCLDEALPCHQAAVKANPRHPTYRQFFCNHHVVRAELLLSQGDYGGAVKLGEDLPRTLQRYSDLESGAAEFFTAARILSRCSAEVEKDTKLPDRAMKAQTYAKSAVQLLEKAVEKGYRDVVPLRKAPYFVPLQMRDDFKKLLASLEEKAKSNQGPRDKP